MKSEELLINKNNFLKTFIKSNGFKAFRNALVSILFGVLIGFLIILISNPGNSLRGLKTLLLNPFISSRPLPRNIGEIFYKATPIILTGLAVGFAFKTGVFNIGASGQYTVGIFGAAVVGLYGSDKLGSFTWIVAVLVGGLSGALWGAISGTLKAFFNVNIVIAGIMLNYIGMFFVNGMIGGPLKSKMLNDLTNRTYKIPVIARTPFVGLNKIFPRSGVDLSFIIAIILAMIVYLVLSKTVFGRELKSVGLNNHAAKYAGVNEKFAIIISMGIAGFFAGLAGAFFILAQGAHQTGIEYARVNEILPAGFNGIPVALLASNNPIGIIFSGLFISYIQHSSIALQSLGYAAELVDVVIGVILYFSAFALIVGQYLDLLFTKNRKELEQKGEVTAWNQNSS